MMVTQERLFARTALDFIVFDVRRIDKCIGSMPLARRAGSGNVAHDAIGIIWSGSGLLDTYRRSRSKMRWLL
jgi:hypothetical protein